MARTTAWETHMRRAAEQLSRACAETAAHMSGDETMRSAFLEGQDIHSRTAAEVYDVPLDQVTPQMRSSAKAVNFGIVYGISASVIYGLILMLIG